MRTRPRGGWTHGQYRWAAAAAWLGGELAEIDAKAARAELLRRWLEAYGPATETDVRWWTGWTAREARAALAAVPHALVELDGVTGYVLANDVDPPDAVGPWVAPSDFDPTARAEGAGEFLQLARAVHARQSRPHRLVQRPGRGRLVSERTARSSSAVGRRHRGRPSRGRGAGSASGWGTPGSRRASCRHSSDLTG